MCALDWQLATFRTLEENPHVTFIGGYGLEQIAPRYPQLDYVAAPDWEHSGALHSLLRAPLDAADTLVCYGDTVFHEAALRAVAAGPSDVVFGYDSEWRERYPDRADADIGLAELIDIANGPQAEFTGLLRLNAKAVGHLAAMSADIADGTLVDLMDRFRAGGLSVSGIDIAHQWAEFNDQRDIARFVLGTKAETLARLEGRVTSSRIEPQITFSVNEWQADRTSFMQAIAAQFPEDPLIVRSSSAREDDWSTSGAGRFVSSGDVAAGDPHALAEAVDAVIASYGDAQSSGDDQVLVQSQVRNVAFAGVVLTCGLATGAPYYRINIETGGSTDVVTAGREGRLRTVTLARKHTGRLDEVDPALVPVIEAVQEIENLVSWERLDIELAVGADGQVHVFQVRPLVVEHAEIELDLAEFEEQVERNIAQFERLQAPSSGIVGGRTVFGVMPDWNPAEIIGTRPRPLALDLYRRLVTDEVWAGQRAQAGFRDVRPQPLLASFSGQPFVDVRASLNSFIPATVSDAAARRLVDAQLAVLQDDPSLHDKLEFAVAFTAWDPTLRAAARQRYGPYGIEEPDLEELDAGLQAITRRAITRLAEHIAPIAALQRAHDAIDVPSRAPGDRAVELVEACARLGTPAFAHAARHGFVAIALLRRMVDAGSLSPPRMQAFLKSLTTINRQLQSDCAKGNELSELAARYGHLRPGTYEVTAEAYWENPARYFLDRSMPAAVPEETFRFEGQEVAWCEDLLERLGNPTDVAGFTRYLRSAIEAREQVKFDFTRTLSRALDLLVEAAPGWGLDREDMSFLGYADVRELVFGALTKGRARQAVAMNRQGYSLCQTTELPPILFSRGDFHGFEHAPSEPNFVTLGHAVGRVAHAEEGYSDLAGAIVLAQRADPGFDWLFGHGIAGLVTRYGGGNSHMAIRSAELGIPAAIGVGDMLYRRISSFRMIELDCGQRTIREL